MSGSFDVPFDVLAFDEAGVGAVPACRCREVIGVTGGSLGLAQRSAFAASDCPLIGVRWSLRRG